MRHALAIPVAIALATFALAGCGEQRPGTAAARPDWIANPSLDGQLGAVGSAPRGPGGSQQALDQATASARAELARSLSVTVETSYKDAFSATSDWKGRAGGADASTLAHELTENVTHQVSTQVLRGSQRRATYTDAATGETFAWVAIPRGQELGDTVTKAAESALAQRGLDAIDVSKRLEENLAHQLR